jgi:glycerol-3-phosphate dehydrogenase
VLDARAALECAPAVARVIARELGRDEAWAADQVSSFENRARDSLL